MQCCPNKLIYIQKNSFLYLVKKCPVIFFFQKKHLKILGFFLSLEGNKEH